MSSQTQEYSNVIAKFRVNEKQGKQISLSAVTDEMNKSWAEATPNGSLNMTIDNQSALDQFEEGHEYILTFQDASSWSGSPSGSGKSSSSS